MLDAGFYFGTWLKFPMNKKSTTLRLDPVSKIILLILGAGVWFMALKPIASNSAHAQVNLGNDSERFAPAPWNSLGQNQMLIDRGLETLKRQYGYSRLEAYAHFICWELSAIERRGAGSP